LRRLKRLGAAQRLANVPGGARTWFLPTPPKADLSNSNQLLGYPRHPLKSQRLGGFAQSADPVQTLSIALLPFPSRILEDLSPTAKERSQTQEPRMHPFLLAQSWRQQMKHDAKLNKARIAAREGISRARVTQVMNLLQLPAEIQADLLKPPAPLEIRSFSERSLRALVSYEDEETQTSRWRELVQKLKGSAGN